MTKYHATFNGRLKGAIGIFYAIRAFTEGETKAAAEMKLYEAYEHIQGLRLDPLVQRYVPTYLAADGLRTFMGAAQGRHTHEGPEGAQAWIDAVKTNNDTERLRSLWGDPDKWEVRACWCWPGHFDPVGIYFD